MTITKVINTKTVKASVVIFATSNSIKRLSKPLLIDLLFLQVKKQGSVIIMCGYEKTITSKSNSLYAMLFQILAVWGCMPEITKDCGDMTNASSTYLSIALGAIIGVVISW